MNSIKIKPNCVARLQKGYPWVYTHQIASAYQGESGELVYLLDSKKRPFAIGYNNPRTKLACRVLTLNIKTAINVEFFSQLFAKALSAREKRFTSPYYRLVHAESDHLPGLIVERFDDTLVCQTNTAGMEKLKPLWLPALVQVLAPKNVIFRDDAPAREKEGLPLAVSAPIGKLPDEMTVIENGLSFSCSPGAGQKTGWFFDHRANRQFVAKQCKGKSVLDLYCYSGGFGILAATHGAAAVTLVDSSQSALDLAQKAANNNPIGNCQLDFVKENVFSILETLKENAQSFDLVLADPPAFVKQLQNKGAGLRGYQKLAKQASFLVAPKGKLFIASCSHHANAADFRQMVEAGIAKAGRQATLLYKGGADKDHPVHPLLPETHYLKSLMYQLD